MKHKLKAIIDAPCDAEIKAELLEEFVKACSEDYLIFTTDRNDMMVSLMGLHGFDEDAQTVDKTELWVRFKDYLTEKYKPHVA